MSSTAASCAPFTLARTDSVDSVIDVLNAWGLVRILGFVKADAVASLLREFEQILTTRERWVHPIAYQAGAAVSLDGTRLQASRFPSTHGLFFATPLMQQVADRVLGPGNSLNHEIFLTHDQPRPFTINDLHFDRIPTLKYFLYLSDTTARNGAFDAVPGSHVLSRAIRERALAKGVRVHDLPNRDLPCNLGPHLPVEGEAGTLIIFHTDVFHRGGHVSEGTERRSMRGHTRPAGSVVYRAPIWARQWWRESISRAKSLVGRGSAPAGEYD